MHLRFGDFCRDFSQDTRQNRKTLSLLTKALAVSAVDSLRNSTLASERTFATAAWSDLTHEAGARFSNLLRYLLSARVAIATTSKKPSDGANSISLDLGIAVSNLSNEKLFQFFPGAKETLDLVVEDWIGAQILMLARLKRDRWRLKSIVPGIVGGRVKHITPGLSDPHERGRTVTEIQFANGARVIYKPRPCEGERIWFAALEWLNRNGFKPGFEIPKFLSRKKYCWMSFVEHRACRSKDAVRRFYFRWGAQAALAQLLGCADLHRQNWIASGEQPMLVDAEMLGDAFSSSGRRFANDGHLHPILRTGLLPLIEADGVGFYAGIAPFDYNAPAKEENIFWPTYQRRPERPGKYIREIVDGFIAASRFVCGSGGRFFRHCNLATAQPRLLKRATMQYQKTLEESLQPQRMQKRGQRFEYLLERCGKGRIARIEASCLMRCSIPRFTGRLSRRRTAPVPTLRALLRSARVFESRLAGNLQPRRHAAGGLDSFTNAS